MSLIKRMQQTGTDGRVKLPLEKAGMYIVLITKITMRIGNGGRKYPSYEADFFPSFEKVYFAHLSTLPDTLQVGYAYVFNSRGKLDINNKYSQIDCDVFTVDDSEVIKRLCDRTSSEIMGQELIDEVKKELH